MTHLRGYSGWQEKTGNRYVNMFVHLKIKDLKKIIECCSPDGFNDEKHLKDLDIDVSWGFKDDICLGITHDVKNIYKVKKRKKIEGIIK